MKDERYAHIPSSPGIYIMKDGEGKILYIGKAVNLQRRVSSYFNRPHDYRIQKMVSLIKKIAHKETDTALEALILEAEFIKRYQPPYNVLEKDDKSFLYVEITKEKFPRVLLVRGKSLAGGKRFGPFIYGGSIREALKILRKIFPFSTHPTNEVMKRPCFDYQIGLCPGTCAGVVSKEEYGRNIKNLILIFEGKKKKVLKSLESGMKVASKNLDFEKAEILRRQIFGLKHIQDVALISDSPIVGSENAESVRIEGYDISNISGTSAVGSMVVFQGGEPDKNEYRKFKIRTLHTPNDIGMLREVLERRFSRERLSQGRGWKLPDLILIDGGLGQVNAARSVLLARGLKIPIVGLAKGPTRKKVEFVGMIPTGIETKTLVKVRDEAHRFAISYYRKLHRSRTLI